MRPADRTTPVLRRIVEEPSGRSLEDRLALSKALIPAVARDMSPIQFEALIIELRPKGQRFYDATLHPGI